MRHTHRFFFSVLFLLSWLSLRAEWIPITRSFTPNDYHASTQNWMLTEQNNGWIYAANNYGVLEYDGASWRLYGIGNSTVVRAVAHDKQGRIYAGGTNDFGYFTYNAFGGMDYHSMVDSLPPAYRQFGEVWQIFPSDECVYVQTRSYLFIFSEGCAVQVIDPADIIKTSLLTNGEFYMATSRGVFVLTGNRLHALRGSELLKDATVCALVPWTEGAVLIATDFAGLFLYDGDRIRPFRTEVDRYICDNQLYTVAANEDCLALGTVLNGVVLLDKDGKHPTFYTRKQGLQNNTVLSLLFDRHANLWIGLDQGIDCIQRALPMVQLNNRLVDFGAGYSACASGNKLYFGTNQGLYVLGEGAEGSGTDEANHPRLVQGSLGQVWDIREVDGRLFCSHNRGLFEVIDGRLCPLYTNDGVWSVRPYRDNAVIAGTYNGFLLLNGSNVTHLSGFHETALYYEIDAANNLWILTSRGVEKLTLNSNQTSLTSTVVMPYPAAHRDLSLSRVGDSIFISGEDYFGVVNADGELVETDPQSVGLPNLSRPVGKLARYLLVRRTESGELVYITPDDMPAFFIGGFANIAFDARGDIIMGGISGFRKITLGDGEIPKASSPSELIPTGRQQEEENVSEVFYFRRLRTISPTMETVYGEGAQYGCDFTENAPITLPANIYSLKVEFAGSNPLADNVRFSTRLWPAEQEFSAFTNASEREFTALRAGTYRLDVQMLDEGDALLTDTKSTSPVVRSLYITVSRPWYASWYAIVLYCLIIGAFACYVAFAVRRRINANKQRIVDEKNRQLQEQQVRILQLENDKAQFSLRQKSQELSSMLLSENARKELTNDVLLDVRRCLDAINMKQYDDARSRMIALQNRLAKNADANVDWQRFEDNYDLVNDQFIQRLKQTFPWMNKQERRLAVYIRMGLTSKEIAPLLNISTRGVDMMRYRMREKMELPAHTALKQYFNEL